MEPEIVNGTQPPTTMPESLATEPKHSKERQEDKKAKKKKDKKKKKLRWTTPS
jgi:hypothetical protein